MLFLDCEFTDFAFPKLLSIGVVSDDQSEFYAELDLSDPSAVAVVAEANRFVRDVVLVQWGVVPGAAMTYTVMGQELSAWLAARPGPRWMNYDSSVDYNLLETLLAHRASPAQLDLVPQHIGYLLEDAEGCAGAAKSWAETEEQGPLRHHALADARSLRARFHAVHGWPADTAARLKGRESHD